MRKKAIIISAIVLLIAVLTAAGLYFIPQTTQIDKTLTLTKLDAEGNEAGTFEVHITGKKLTYLFQEERMLLEIDPFDNIEDIQAAVSGSPDGKDTTGVVSHFGQEYGKNYNLIYLEGYDRSDGLTFVSMSFCLLGDFDNFEELSIHCHGIDAVSLDHTNWSYVAYGDGR